ncbi:MULTISPECIES: zinc transporter ZntB [Tatumella]|uniref:Zinc transporter ZntB n=1 Tax=Tatumella punctata TaxID=399969 RepID=A0ABW1VIP9_9GAMM|nr:zinc transporter ZntB [Tatumella sp. JGM16]MBS0876230.1 zinc transporter ZntB [Tatumella sp. JGM82]MBS0889279.1 zinc transporter ZntB [Tatumella sp. JGM94]MBS0893623.1 zinc transporter ZntB [Tatumella sp. JGM130]MBS0902307.1 zinc transporter ZntB [Tatumella sp. JGM100]MBS0911492.1 zinc transporter ZntB [Tatumella sp. JGM91]
MSIIDGKELHIPDAIISCQLDGQGGMLPISETEVVNSEHACWLHLNYAQQESAEWLQDTPLLPDSVRDALAGESMRPRITKLADGFMITLRSINFNHDSRPDELVAVRIFINDRLIVSTRQRKVAAVDDVWSSLKNKAGPENAGDWLVEFCDALTDHISEFIEDLHDKIIDLEDGLLEGKVPQRGQMALLRKQLIVMRRYMAPQRDVLARIASEKSLWLDDAQRRLLQDIADRLGRGLEDLDAGVARTAVLNDEISSQMTESMNKRTYIMSLLAMIFLPATFLTGLFGVNLGGIPGGQWSDGFSVFCVILVVIALMITLWLKNRKWL